MTSLDNVVKITHSVDIIDAQFARARDRIDKSMHPNFSTISMRRGDQAKFGDKRIKALTDALYENEIDVSISVPDGDPESDLGKLVDLLIGRLNRQLTAVATARRLGDRRLVRGVIQFSLRAGDRTKLLQAAGSARSQTTVEAALVDHIMRETGGGARLVISGAQLEPQTAEQFFGSQTANVIEGDIEQSFINLMVSTATEVNGYIAKILLVEPSRRRTVFWQILKSMERKNTTSLMGELLQKSNLGQYLFFEKNEVKLMTVDELLEFFGFSRKAFFGLGIRLPQKKAALKTALDNALSKGCRVFRITA